MFSLRTGFKALMLAADGSGGGSEVVDEVASEPVSEQEPVSIHEQVATTEQKAKLWFRERWRELATVVIGAVIYAFAVAYFTLPYRFPDLGLTGISVLANYVFGISAVWVTLIGNILMIAWGRKNLSLRFIYLTALFTVVLSVALAIFEKTPLPLSEDKFMGAVISGMLKGASTGLLFNIGGSTGGTDIIAMVMRRRYDLEVGRFNIIFNFLLLGLSMEVVGIDAVVYGAIAAYINGIITDTMARSFDRRKQAFIITNIPKEVGQFITSMGRGVTMLHGEGVYTGQDRPVLMTLLAPRQVVQVKRFLRDKDPKAFLSICDASEVIGQGFKAWKSL